MSLPSLGHWLHRVAGAAFHRAVRGTRKGRFRLPGGTVPTTSRKPARITPPVIRTILRAEMLEDRLAPAAVSWDGGAGTLQWGDAANWSTDVLPSSTDDVTINAASEVIHSTGTDVINSLITSSPLRLTGGVLDVETTAQIGASLTLSGGTLRDATVNASGGAKLISTAFQGTLDGVVLNADLDMGTTSAHVTILNGLELNGTATVGSNTSMNFSDSQTLMGTGTVVFSNNSNTNALRAVTGGMTLTIGPGITIRGGSLGGNSTSAIGYHVGFGGPTNITVINQGTILADSAGNTLSVNSTATGPVFMNQGVLQANGGVLIVNGIAGNIGQATMTGAGSRLSFVGTNYTNNLALTVGAGQTLSLDGTWSNVGGLNVAGGTLDMRGSRTIAQVNPAAFTYSSGTVNLRGTLDNTGATLALAANTGSWSLAGGTIVDGEVAATDGAKLIATSFGGTLDGVVLNSDLDMSAGSSNVTVINGLELNGMATLGSNASISFSDTQTLSGTGTVVFPNVGNSALRAATSAMTLTIGPDITVRGGSGATATIGYSTFGGPDDITLVNKGTIIADIPGATLRINSAGFTTPVFRNEGILQANGGSLIVNGITGNIGTATITGTSNSMSFVGTNYANDLGLTVSTGQMLSLDGTWSNVGGLNLAGGTLDLRGAFTLAEVNLAALNYSAGTVNLRGTLDNTSTTLPLSASTGSWSLTGGTILGGTITATGGAKLIATPTGGTLDGVILNTDLDLNASSSYVTVINGLELNGTATLGNSTHLSFSDTQTLSGTGMVIFTNVGNCALRAATSAMTLTIGPGITLRGGSGATAGIGYSNVFGGPADITLVNQGTIVADIPGAVLRINNAGVTASVFRNEGILQATGGSLIVNGMTGNIGQATMTGAGSSMSFVGTSYINNLGLTVGAGQTLSLDGTWTNVGGLNVDGGTLDLRGSRTTAEVNPAAFTYTSGTVNLWGTLDNTGATLNLGVNTGPWMFKGGTILGGTVTATGGAKLTVSSSGGRLNDVILNSDLDLLIYDSFLWLDNGPELNGTVTLGDRARLAVDTTQLISGQGTIVFTDVSGGNGIIMVTNGTSLTIGPGLRLRGGSRTNGARSVIGTSNTFPGGSNVTIINQGAIVADAPGMEIQVNATGSFINEGLLEARAATVTISSLAQVTTSSSLQSTSDGTITTFGILGDTTNVSGYQASGTMRISGGTQLNPRFLEAMSRDDIGTGSAASFLSNFAYGRIELAAGSYVNVLDQSDNSFGAGDEAIFAETVVVPAGATLDLNDLPFYARVAQIDGTVLNGTIRPIVDSATPVFLPSGVEFQAATLPGSVTFDQLSASVATDALGNFVVVWDAPGVSGSDIFAQRYDRSGVPLGPSIPVNSTTTGEQRSPVVARDSLGNFVVAWEGPDATGRGIVGRRFGFDGTPLGGEFAVNTTTMGEQFEPAIASDDSGNFVVAFTSGSDVRVRLYDRLGNPAFDDFLVFDDVLAQRHPTVAMDAGGEFVVAWETSTDDIQARLFTGSGAAKADRFIANESLIGANSDPSIAVNVFGDFVIAWTRAESGAENVFARSFNGAGAPVSGDIQVNTFSPLAQRNASVATNAEGDFVVAWQSEAQDGSGFGIYAQRYDRSGAPLDTEDRVHTFRTGDQVEPAVAMDANGDFVITWLSRTPDGTGTAVFGQRFYLSPADRFEFPTDNDVVARATELGTVQGTRVEAGLSIDTPSDVDWFRFTTTGIATLGHSIRLDFNYDQGDLSLELHDAAGRLRSSLSAGNSEEISLAGLSAGTYRVRVFGTAGAASPSYAMTLIAPQLSGADRFESNDTQFAATDLNPLTGPRLEQGLSIHAAGNDDWYSFMLNEEPQEGHIARIEFLHAQGDLDLELYDEVGLPVVMSATAVDFEEISLAGLFPGTYYLQVRGFVGATNPDYSLRIEPPAPVVADYFETPISNGNIDDATNLGPIVGGVEFRNLSIHDGDVDFYQFTTIADSTGSHELSLAFNRAVGDLRFRVFDALENELAVSTPRDDGAVLSLANLPAGSYFINVEPIGPAASFYSLTIDAPADFVDPIDEWTILVYMTASDLSGRAFNDINELERAATRLEGNVNLVVYLDQAAASPFATGGGSQPAWGGAGRAVIEPERGLGRIATTFALLGEQNSGDPAILLDFIRWGLAERPADRTALILWGHGLGVFGSNFDNHDPQPHPDPLESLEIEEVQSALATLETTDGIRFDIVAYDASLMGMAEVVGAIGAHTDVVVASEQVGESLGFDYDAALGAIVDLDLDEVDARTAASQFVESYKARYHGRSTLTAFDTALYNSFTAALNGFVTSVVGTGTVLADEDDFEAIANARSGSRAFVLPEFRDLGTFLSTVSGTAGVTTSIRNAAQAAHDALRQMVLAEATNPQAISGLSIYFPDDLTTSDALSYFGMYEGFDQATRWFDFLEAFTGSAGSKAGSYDPDRFETPERNDLQSLASRLQALTGSNVFNSLSIDRSGDRDFFRFTTSAVGSAGNRIQLDHDHQVEGTAPSISVTLFTDAGTQIGTPVVTVNGTGSISLDTRPAGDYLIRIQTNGVVPRYTMTIDAPTMLPAADQAGGNDTRTKAFELTGIVNDPLFTGFVLPAAPSPGARAFDWFRFDGPPVVEAETKSITVRSDSSETVRVRLLDGDGVEVTAAEGIGEIEVTSPLSPGTYYLEVSSTSQTGIGYSVEFLETTPSDTVPPTVAGVRLRGTAWTTAGWYSIPAGANQLLPVPWTNLNQVQFVFSENVAVQQNHLIIMATVGSYTFAGGFTYDAQTFTATWVFVQTFVPDKIMLVLSDGVEDNAGNALDGEWTGTTDSYPSGEGSEGGVFSFRFNVLPGDVNGTGNVDVFDPLFTRLRVGLQEGQLNYASQYDVNSDGQIDVFDVLFVRLRVGQTTPPGEPGIRFASRRAAFATSKTAIDAAPLVLDLPSSVVANSQLAERRAKRAVRLISASAIDHLLIEWDRDYQHVRPAVHRR